MNEQEIKNILTKHPDVGKYFGGVFASDELPKNVKLDDEKNQLFFVVNIDESHEPGSHWVVCGLCKKPPNVYFDSYGQPPFLPNILAFLGAPNILYNDTPVQFPLSTACGQWCCFFILHQISGFSLDSFVRKFSKNSKLENDHAINNWLRKVFGFREEVIDRKFLQKQIAKSWLQNRMDSPWYN